MTMKKGRINKTCFKTAYNDGRKNNQNGYHNQDYAKRFYNICCVTKGITWGIYKHTERKLIVPDRITLSMVYIKNIEFKNTDALDYLNCV